MKPNAGVIISVPLLFQRCFANPALALAGALLLTAAVANVSHGQEAVSDSQSASLVQYRQVFEDVQRGISSGTIGLLARHFAPQVAIKLRGDENDTFSSNQAFYVLENFFKLRRFGRFEFSTIGESEANPYATGDAEFTFKGNRELVQVYVALSFDGKNYVITQLTIY